MIYTVANKNEYIAEALDQIAILLEAQQASPFRINAYKKAARTIREESRAISEIFEKEGRAGLIKLPGIGKSIGSAVEEYLQTGKINVASRMEDEMTPEELFMTVPGIGAKLADKIYHELKIHTLEDLEVAAYDGRLEEMEGFGSRRTRAIQQHLSVMLSRSGRLRAQRAKNKQFQFSSEEFEDPEVEVLLAMDEIYHLEAKAGRLRMIAPRRFNPEGKAWLPVMNTEHDGWLFTVMYSNTARAHELGKTNDWVVIFFEKKGEQHQCTVVTEWQGVLTGKRVVRGREAECVDFYKK